MKIPALNIRSKLLGMVLLIGIGTVGTSQYFSIDANLKALEIRIQTELQAMQASKASEIEAYLRRLRREVIALSKGFAMIDAMKALSREYRLLGGAPVSEEQRRQLAEFYERNLVPEIRRNKGDALTGRDYVPQSPASVYLQYHYILECPDPERRRHLADAGDGSGYSAVHAKYDPLFTSYADTFDCEDLLLVENKTGQVVYSIAKEPDFVTDTATGPFKATNMARAIQESRQSTFPDFVKLVDYEPYEPAGGLPRLFIASPIFDGDEHIGELILQFAVTDIDRIISGDSRWREIGLGETGDNYLVGSDRTLRSNPRLLRQNPTKYFSFLRAEGVPPVQRERILRLKSAILQHKVQSEFIEAGLRGESGIRMGEDFLSRYSVAMYSPFKVQGLQWVLITRVDLTELMVPVVLLKERLRHVTLIVVLIATGVGLLIAKTFLEPVEALIRGAKQFAACDYDVRVPVTSRDEFADLVNTFNDMARSVGEQARIIQAKNAENERLLLNILPGPIAERLKSGEQSIADGFAEVSVLFADIVGFTTFSAKIPAEQLVPLLNDLFRRFDEAAIRLGIEKIKTIGDCYMAVCGLPTPHADHAARLVRMGLEMLRILDEFDQERGLTLSIRVGINSGPVVAGVIGASKFIYDLWGDTVNLASRMESTGVPGAIQVSESVFEALQGQFPFEDRGLIEVKGKGQQRTWILRKDTVCTEPMEVLL